MSTNDKQKPAETYTEAENKFIKTVCALSPVESPVEMAMNSFDNFSPTLLLHELFAGVDVPAHFYHHCVRLWCEKNPFVRVHPKTIPDGWKELCASKSESNEELDARVAANMHPNKSWFEAWKEERDVSRLLLLKLLETKTHGASLVHDVLKVIQKRKDPTVLTPESNTTTTCATTTATTATTTAIGATTAATAGATATPTASTPTLTLPKTVVPFAEVRRLCSVHAPTIHELPNVLSVHSRFEVLGEDVWFERARLRGPFQMPDELDQPKDGVDGFEVMEVTITVDSTAAVAAVQKALPDALVKALPSAQLRVRFDPVKQPFSFVPSSSTFSWIPSSSTHKNKDDDEYCVMEEVD